MQYITIAIIVLFASCLAMVFLEMFALDCNTATNIYREKKMREFEKKNKGAAPEDMEYPMTEFMSIPSGPCSNVQQRVRGAISFFVCSIAVLLFVYGLLTGQFNFWAKKNA